MTAHPANSYEVAALIDHTLLKPEATRAQVERLCAEGLQHDFASVCVNSAFVAQVARLLRNSPVKTCVVVGFPLGANLSEVKVYEAEKALNQGAQEIDMVINVGTLKAGDDASVKHEIESLAAACHQHHALLKVILETSLLNEYEKVRACKAARDARADFVKTSTGFGSAGATVEDVALLRSVVGPEMGVKASGGIRTLEALLKMVEAGATRIGTSNGLGILQEAKAKFAG